MPQRGQTSGGSQQPFASQIKRQAEPIRSQLASPLDLPGAVQTLPLLTRSLHPGDASCRHILTHKGLGLSGPAPAGVGNDH